MDISSKHNIKKVLIERQKFEKFQTLEITLQAENGEIQMLQLFSHAIGGPELVIDDSVNVGAGDSNES